MTWIKAFRAAKANLARFAGETSGRLQAAQLGPERLERARKAAIFDFVSVSGTTDMFGHSYFTSNPEVSSDIIALIRYGAKPGDAQRPLVEVARPFWRVRTAADDKH